jgi:Centromere DNA-binding protein complex CBF3 subunit, domain 2
VQRYGDIEEEFWNDAAALPSRRCLNTRLRHRMSLLFLTSAVLRSDSLYKADVSDFFGMSPPKKDGDVHQPWILINQIAEGKTSHGKMQYGRAIRHKDVRRCAVGGIATYMMNREDIMGEFGNMSYEDWCKNPKWFNKKFLVDVKGSDYEAEMVSDSYAEHIRAVLLRLGLPTNKLRHLGRGCGTKKLDFEEVSEDLI